jgi:hypothetical protein
MLERESRFAANAHPLGAFAPLREIFSSLRFI